MYILTLSVNFSKLLIEITYVLKGSNSQVATLFRVLDIRMYVSDRSMQNYCFIDFKKILRKSFGSFDLTLILLKQDNRYKSRKKYKKLLLIYIK